ncbi:MAG: DNA repair protein RecO [Rhodobacteraceae bacterium]|nr:DNA repair protein RecO [Paracoccaceae bacterium]
MEWQDRGILLGVRKHGESAAILSVLTAARGLHAGVLPGGASRARAPELQPGNELSLEWRARLDEHIGTFRTEPARVRAGLMASRGGLLGLNAVCALLLRALPERVPQPEIWASTSALLDRMEGAEGWAADYLRWEMGLLDQMGYGLDLHSCALSGATEGLVWVSPRSGRAVSAAAAGDWATRLLPLPGFLLEGGAADGTAAADAARLTGHFLARAFAAGPGAPEMPEARARLVMALAGGRAG